MAYTTVDDGSQYFNTVLYTGNGSTNAITGVGFQPDWVWGKCRSAAQHHRLFDSSRGALKNIISSATNAEATTANSLTSFDSDGFTLGSDDNLNFNTRTFVAWNWKANAGTTSSNTDGSITSTVQANTTAGFSIVTYTGTGSNATVGHGLGKAPEWIMIKRRDATGEWIVYQKSFSEDGSGEFNLVNLNDTDATQEFGAFNFMQSTSPTSSVFYTDGQSEMNASGGTFVAYCFAPIQGYSKFGTYEGNGNADGPFVYTGFKPAFILMKNIDGAENWLIYDNKRDPDNVIAEALLPNSSSATGGSSNAMDLLSNGFKLRQSAGSLNGSNKTFIYMAFAEHPFVSSKGVPVTAR